MDGAVAAEGAAGAADGAQEQQGGGGVDLTPVMERLDGLAPQLSKLEQLAQSLVGGDAGDGGEPDEFEFDLDALYNDGAQEQQGGLDLQALMGQFDQRTQQVLQQALAPVQQQVQDIQTSLEAEQLAAKYPDLAKREIAEPVVKKAQELAEAAGNPALANNMQFLEVVYKASMADQYAAGERPVGAEQGFELERAGGSGPAAGEGPNIAERLVSSKGAEAPWRRW